MSLMGVRGCDLCGDTCSDRLHRYGTEMLAVCSVYAVRLYVYVREVLFLKFGPLEM